MTLRATHPDTEAGDTARTVPLHRSILALLTVFTCRRLGYQLGRRMASRTGTRVTAFAALCTVAAAIAHTVDLCVEARATTAAGKPA